MEYDENGNNIKSTLCDGTGKVESYRISEYDSDNNQVKNTVYDETGNVKEYGKYEEVETESGATGQQLRIYDANGKLIER